GMANLRPRPTRQQIALWQDDARNRLGEPAPDPAEWQDAASFVVVFSQRRMDGTWERRVEAERTEVEPERSAQVWSGWNAAPVCAWLAGPLRQAGAASRRCRPRYAPASAAARAPPPAAPPRTPSRPRPRPGRSGTGLSSVSTAPRSSTRRAGRTW